MTQQVVFSAQRKDSLDCVILQRPSFQNKSPYVADVRHNETTHLAYVPSLSLSGKCVPGTFCLMNYAKDKKGNRIGPDCISPKYGKKKCELHSFLVLHKGTWIASHPKIGEKIATCLLNPGTIYEPISKSKIISCTPEVSHIAQTNMRVDFLLGHDDGSFTMVEVKTVVDSEEDLPASLKSLNMEEKGAIFPFGKKTQNFDGQKVVSERAIKHVSELTLVSKKLKKDAKYLVLNTCVLFIVVRGDCKFFRPHHKACPVFRQKLIDAQKSGVLLIAHQFDWNVDDVKISCLDKGVIPVVLE